MLSDAKIRAAKPREKAFKLTDGHRLYLEVMPGGSKLWRWSYYYCGKQKTMSLGNYPRVSLLDARLKRDEARGQLEAGQDPVMAKRLLVEANQRQADRPSSSSPGPGMTMPRVDGAVCMPMTFCAVWSGMCLTASEVFPSRS
jgi:hypothetical protein